jgi:hypothetical protein
MVMQRVSRVLLAEQYTGSNGADVLAMCQMITQYSGNAWTIDSDNGTTLVLRESSPLGLVGRWPILKDQWCLVAPDTGIVARMPDAVYQVRYKTLSSIATDAIGNPDVINAIAASSPVQSAIVAEVAKVKFGGFGVAPLPVLIAGATSSVIQVPILPVQPSTGYAAEAFAISGAAVLTTLSIVSMTKVITDAVTGKSGRVDVVVRNNGAASVGGILMVHITASMPGSA